MPFIDVAPSQLRANASGAHEVAAEMRNLRAGQSMELLSTSCPGSKVATAAGHAAHEINRGVSMGADAVEELAVALENAAFSYESADQAVTIGNGN